MRVSQCSSHPFTGSNGITKYNFAAALGLPKEFHGEEPQVVYRHWRLREGQFLFLQEKIPELYDASVAVRLWDEQHRLFFFFPQTFILSQSLLS